MAGGSGVVDFQAMSNLASFIFKNVQHLKLSRLAFPQCARFEVTLPHPQGGLIDFDKSSGPTEQFPLYSIPLLARRNHR